VNDLRGLVAAVSARNVLLGAGCVDNYSPQRAIAELSAQHAMLRGMIERCESLADQVDAGACGPLQLIREVTRLRLAFEAHNRFEEQMLRPLLLADVGAAALERQIDDHIAAHRAMRLGLASTETSALRDVIGAMRAHLDAEEHQPVSTSVMQVAAIE
jgi:hypothetical protein